MYSLALYIWAFNNELVKKNLAGRLWELICRGYFYCGYNIVVCEQNRHRTFVVWGLITHCSIQRNQSKNLLVPLEKIAAKTKVGP